MSVTQTNDVTNVLACSSEAALRLAGSAETLSMGPGRSEPCSILHFGEASELVVNTCFRTASDRVSEPQANHPLPAGRGRADIGNRSASCKETCIVDGLLCGPCI